MRRAVAMTVNPSADNARTVAAPIPLLAPVTSATLLDDIGQGYLQRGEKRNTL